MHLGDCLKRNLFYHSEESWATKNLLRPTGQAWVLHLKRGLRWGLSLSTQPRRFPFQKHFGDLLRVTPRHKTFTGTYQREVCAEARSGSQVLNQLIPIGGFNFLLGDGAQFLKFFSLSPSVKGKLFKGNRLDLAFFHLLFHGRSIHWER